MMLLYGCQAPWLQTSNNKTCEIDLDIKTMESAEIDKILDIYNGLQVLDMYNFMPECPKPCVTMNIKLKTLSSETTDTLSYLGVWKSEQVCYLIYNLNKT